MNLNKLSKGYVIIYYILYIFSTLITWVWLPIPIYIRIRSLDNCFHGLLNGSCEEQRDPCKIEKDV